jgi:Lon protease-like protein
VKIPAEVPVMALPNAILFPQALLPLYIFEDRYRQMLADCLKTDRMFLIALTQKETGKKSEQGKPCSVAGLGIIRVAVVTSHEGHIFNFH